MSTVTLSQPHCAMVSAEKPLGMASHALTQALPSLRRFFSVLDEFMTAFPLFSGSGDHRQAGAARPWRPVAVRVHVVIRGPRASRPPHDHERAGRPRSAYDYMSGRF